jgi:hypothetical protein
MAVRAIDTSAMIFHFLSHRRFVSIGIIRGQSFRYRGCIEFEVGGDVRL